LYERHGVSTVLVMGGCGDYFDVADTVMAMQDYRPFDVTEAAQRIARELRTKREIETTSPLAGVGSRVPAWESLDPSRGKRDVKIEARSVEAIAFGHEVIDLSGVEQLVDASQTRAIGYALHLASRRVMGGGLQAIVQDMIALFDDAGLDVLDPYHQGERHPGNFARPRAFEIAAALNRLRTLRIKE